MSENRCTAGYAKINITPPLGVSLAGYFDPRPNVGVLDELYVRAVAFGEGEKAAVLIVCDLVNMKGDLSFQWPKRIAERLSLPHEAVFLTHTHTHTGPDVGGSWEDQQYNDWLLRRLGDVAQMALDDRKPVTDVQTAETQTSGMTFVRRFLHKDGHYQTWGSQPQWLNWFFSMAASVLLTLFSYQQAAFDVNLGSRRTQQLTGLTAAFFCIGAIARESSMLYLGGAVWALTNLIPKDDDHAAA
jgi:hypothetical protein